MIRDEHPTPGSLPEFAGTADSGTLLLAVQCRRADCRQEFWMPIDWEQAGRPTAPCPGCFRVSWKPGRKPSEQPTTTKRRIVRRGGKKS